MVLHFTTFHKAVSVILVLAVASLLHADPDAVYGYAYTDGTEFDDSSTVYPLKIQVDVSTSGPNGANAYGAFANEHQISFYGTSVASGFNAVGGSSSAELDQTFTIIGAESGWDGVLTPTLSGYMATRFVPGVDLGAAMDTLSAIIANVSLNQSSSDGYVDAGVEIQKPLGGCLPTITQGGNEDVRSVRGAMIGDTLTTSLYGYTTDEFHGDYGIGAGGLFTQTSLASLGFRSNVNVYLRSAGGQQLVCTPTDGIFVIQTVPEPSTWAVLGLGAAGLLRRRSRR